MIFLDAACTWASTAPPSPPSGGSTSRAARRPCPPTCSGRDGHDPAESDFVAAAASQSASAAGGSRRRRAGSPPSDRAGRQEPSVTPLAIYSLDDVRAALGSPGPSGGRAPPLEEAGEDLPRETEHQARLAGIASRGEAGRWRVALGPGPDTEAQVARLARRAPHFQELSDLVGMNLRAARNMGVPTFLAPVLLIGAAGLGKTWYLSRLSRILGLPFRTYPMSAATLGDGLQGSHPSWRNAEPGLVAKTLLREQAANPVIFVDEFDKTQPGGHNVDPYRPFYALLDPAGSSGFVDEYLGFALDASKVLWVMAANEGTMLPDAILDRLTVIEVPEMTREQRISVAESIYADANAERRSYFEPAAGPGVLERLAGLRPRAMRLAIEAAMARAASERRRALEVEDVRPRRAATARRIGFR